MATLDKAAGRGRVAISIDWGARRRILRLPAALALAALGLAPVLALGCLASGAWLAFHDDTLAALLQRESDAQAAYDARVAELRARIDALTASHQRERAGFQKATDELMERQARLESRATLIAGLAEKIAPERSRAPISQRMTAPVSVSPVPSAAISGKPAPEAFELRGASTLDLSVIAPPTDPSEPLRQLAARAEKLESGQIAAVEQLARPAAIAAEKLRATFDEAGLPVDRLMRAAGARAAKKAGAAPMGGPFEPVAAADQAFSRAYAGVARSLDLRDELRRALPFAPVRAPVAGSLDVTSGYGFRIDPFMGRLALHAGLDMRAEYGAPVRAAGAGRVVTANPASGYGNLVEIDHGAGLSTRYGHLARIDVAEGQIVDSGAVLGEVGSTGRATGPHLHYELRQDGDAIDPLRCLKAGRRLSAGP